MLFRSEIFKIDRQAYERSTYITGQKLLVEINDSLSAKLSNILENDNDINSSEEAINRLTSIMKEYRKTGNKGKINELETKISNKRRELEYALRTEELVSERSKKIEQIKKQIRDYEENKNINNQKIKEISEYENKRLKRQLEILNERLETQKKIERLQEQNNNSKRNNIIISVAIIVISITLGILVSKILFAISTIGILILLIGLINYNNKKQKYEKLCNRNDNDNLEEKNNDESKNKADRKSVV